MLSDSLRFYLDAIYRLELAKKPIKSVRIAEMLSVSKPSVNKAMTELKNQGCIEKDYYTDIVLTSEGRRLALDSYKKYLIIKYFMLATGVPEETAEEDSRKMQFVISHKSIECIKKYFSNGKTAIVQGAFRGIKI